MPRYQGLSYWFDSLGEPLVVRPRLPGPLDVDVCIVGGGFTGLWTARSLLRAQPDLRVVVLEAEVCGFGASGRNGGWASALFAASPGRLARLHGLEAMHRMRRAMQASIDEIDKAVGEEGIDCGFARDGTVVLARDEAQLAKATLELAEARELGIPEDDLRWLGPGELRDYLDASRALGATFTPHCAAIHPGRLVRGLARAVERLGGTVHEGTPVLEVVPGSPGPVSRRPFVRTPAGPVQADVVVLATEAFTCLLPGQRRRLAPVYSLVVATEPIPPEVFQQLTRRGRPTFSDYRNVLVYGQFTTEGRVVFGGRGAPYHFGSRIAPRYDQDQRVHQGIHRALVELFPALAQTRVTHRWGGAVGIPRDWHSSVGYDPRTGLAWAGGYAGDGVTTTNLAGRTLADLVLRRESDLTTLCWVGHRSPDWEPEPLRFLGINAGLLAARLADRLERLSGRPSVLSSLVARLAGHA
ncbi:NAD(P)/FAD-dependent oxidoreductase [Aciditerrimonas ferrireducens]|uniref:NAD(P)/FAD-dependent oxidoreductase n=1 Tax=Aciditerrimonas ferrireducens TaxID=667306 RepID=A0ABV6BYZ3_9ACTN|nr:FAD-dependent oxidoreductase [Aciditerrimonas ferrireducens]MCK4176878.1 FAD-binding oxidoreductase [Aciditerrimonas ferrireducens]